ncbi:DUF2235 domain-containing protein [Vibrio alginolyticus]|uniref:phospholipase effector Tle1 domain-containing protein n=1 Tax=Vibrio alginolyticus TaxID=663 RepID=UPI00215ED4C6|nr:DUF2235 domain-containing protein [Vibrio alginolyticus]MCS0110202.1 DUF2235 domain-containing protein [Vibrio alginolyticus]
MPLEFPKPKRLTSAGYAPVQDDVKLTPPTSMPVIESALSANFECRIKVYAPKADLAGLKLGIFSLGKSDSEGPINRWKTSELVDKTRHCVLTAECFHEETKKLNHEYHLNFGITNTFDIEPKTVGSEHINAEFVPLMLAVQSEDSMGWAAIGFYYYFYENKLTYECDISGGGKWSWLITTSTQSGITAEYTSEQAFNSLLIPAKIEGQQPAKQHILYTRQKLTNDELAEVNESWLDQNATLIDPEKVIKSQEQPPLPRTAPQEDKSTASLNSKKHKVRSKEGGSHESWSEIAAIYGLSAKSLLNLNPSFETDPLALKAGDTLVVEEAVTEGPSNHSLTEQPSPLEGLCTGECYSLGDAWGSYQSADLTPSVKNIFETTAYAQSTPILNVKRVEERVMRIGVFFDGTGQNYKNDVYKETHGVKSRTNVARLFEAYPLKPGIHQKIYVSGVGTVDEAWQTPSLIDEGADESGLAQAFGVDVMNTPTSNSALNSVYNDSLSETTETGAFYKWQSWIVQYHQIIEQLVQDGQYKEVTHIEFDVFGFSRGAALARHFVNAVKDGIPDFTSPRTNKKVGEVYPNLLGIETTDCFDPKNGYQPETSRTCSVRFTGLFDTVGSFYLAGNSDDGNFQLGLDMNCAEHVYQACAHHEYRKNFPLTSLIGSDGIIAGHFKQETFPGCHTDIGGGYPSKHQYNNTNLHERYGIPPVATYNRELIKTESIRETVRQAQSAHEASYISERAHNSAIEKWQVECTSQGVHGSVTLVNGVLYYYELQPISNGLSALPLERMKQQASEAGITWEDPDYELPSDYANPNGIDSELHALREKLLSHPAGSIQPALWQREIAKNGKYWIHRPHDALINPGCDTLYDRVVNDVTKEGNQLKRVVFDNEV